MADPIYRDRVIYRNGAAIPVVEPPPPEYFQVNAASSPTPDYWQVNPPGSPTPDYWQVTP